MLETFASMPDTSEFHSREIAAPPATVYRAVWTTDFGASPLVRALLALRYLPERIFGDKRASEKMLTLQTIIDTGFGCLAEEPGREIVLGISGRFWRPTGGNLPFDSESFCQPVPSGVAQAVWNFKVISAANQRTTILSTETRITCGDIGSRRKFYLY